MKPTAQTFEGFDLAKFMAAAEADSAAVKAKIAELGLDPSVTKAVGLNTGKITAVFGAKALLHATAIGFTAHAAFTRALGGDAAADETAALTKLGEQLHAIAATLPDDLGQIVT